MNPFYKKARKLTGIKNFSEFQRQVAFNGKQIREFTRDYVMKRKNGGIKS